MLYELTAEQVRYGVWSKLRFPSFPLSTLLQKPLSHGRRT
jgi:hypothetical protein